MASAFMSLATVCLPADAFRWYDTNLPGDDQVQGSGNGSGNACGPAADPCAAPCAVGGGGSAAAADEASDGYCAMHRLLTLDAPADEWVDDARAAMRLLLTHGRNSSDGDNTVAIVRGWADALAARFGGQWRPDGPTK